MIQPPSSTTATRSRLANSGTIALPHPWQAENNITDTAMKWKQLLAARTTSSTCANGSAIHLPDSETPSLRSLSRSHSSGSTSLWRRDDSDGAIRSASKNVQILLAVLLRRIVRSFLQRRIRAKHVQADMLVPLMPEGLDMQIVRRVHVLADLQ